MMDALELDFEQAKARHVLFKTRLRSILYGADIDQSPVLSEFECGVGKWIYGHALKAYGHIPEMSELERVHASIHTCAKELIALYKTGKEKEARQGLSRMDDIADHLLALLSDVEQKIKTEKDRPTVVEPTEALNINYKELVDLHRTILELDAKIKEQSKSFESVRREVSQSESRFRNTVLQAPVGITVLRGVDMIVESANERYLELVDRDEKAFVGRSLYDSLPEVRSVVEPLLLNVLRSGEVFHAQDFPVILNRFGHQEEAYFSLVYQPLRDDDNTITGIIVVANEVTAQVKARHALEQSEKQFRNLVTKSPIAMTIFKGRDLIIDIANEKLLKTLWRRPWEEVRGKKLLDVFPELKGQKFPALLSKVFDTGVTYTENEAPAAIDGPGGLRTYFLDFEYAPLFTPDGNVFAIMVTVNDVTEKVESRQLIKDAAERLRLATEGTQLATWDLNLKTREILHSARLAVIFGFDEKKVFTHPEMRTYIHPDDVHAIVEKAFMEALESGVYLYESRVVHPDKSVHWIKTTGKVIFDEDGTPLRMVGTMMDITREKISKRLLEESEERLKIVVEASELGIWELDVKTDKVITSPRYLEIFGVSDDDPSHKNFIQRIDPGFLHLRNTAFQEALQTGVYYYQSAIVWNDQSIHWVEVKGKLFYDESGNPDKMIGTVQDITKEKKYSQRLEESERRFRTVADTAPVMIWLATPDTLCNFFNKAWLDFTGRTMAEQIGSRWSAGVHPDDFKRCMEIYLEAFDKRAPFYMEYRLRRYDGEYRWISDNGVPQFNSDNIFEGYIGACLDIHERLLFEENLKESESRLRIAALSSELGTWSYTPATEVLTWDNQSRELYGVDGDIPVTTELFWSRIHPDDRAASLQKMVNALDPDMMDTYDIEYRVLLSGTDDVRWIHAKGKAFFDDERKPYLFSGTILNITEKRKAMEELQENEAKFRLLADSMPQFVWTGDVNGVLNYFNIAVYQYSGLSPEKIAKDGWLQIVHPDDQEQNISQWVRSIATGEPFIYEHRFRRFDGEYRWQLSRAIPQRTADGRIQMWVGTSTDIHDTKIFMDQLEAKVEYRTQELKITNEELRKSNNELEQFAYVASHDLQEPLRKIQTFATRIMEVENENLTLKGQDYLSRLQASSKRMQQLIQDLLSFSRATSTEKHVTLADMNLLLEKVKDQLSDLIEKNNVTVSSDILPDMSVIPFQMEQMFSNFISNAVKFAKTDTPSVIKITSGFASGKSLVHTNANPTLDYRFISFADNGIGFDQQFSERIFQVFQRLHGREAYEGTGIGLAICKKIAENHGGFIIAKGIANIGATFTFYIPAVI